MFSITDTSTNPTKQLVAIQLPKGFKAYATVSNSGGLPQLMSQGEFVLPRGTTFRVKSRSAKEIVLEVVP